MKGRETNNEKERKKGREGKVRQRLKEARTEKVKRSQKQPFFFSLSFVVAWTQNIYHWFLQDKGREEEKKKPLDEEEKNMSDV